MKLLLAAAVLLISTASFANRCASECRDYFTECTWNEDRDTCQIQKKECLMECKGYEKKVNQECMNTNHTLTKYKSFKMCVSWTKK